MVIQLLHHLVSTLNTTGWLSLLDHFIGRKRMADSMKLAENILKSLDESFLAWGLEDELERIRETLSSIILVLADAEKQRSTDNSISLWLRLLRDVLYDAEDVADDFGYEALRSNIERKVCRFFSSTNPVAFRLRIGHKIKEIRLRLDEIKTGKDKFNFKMRVDHELPRPRERAPTPSVNASAIIGRDGDIEKIVKLVVDSDGHGDSHNVSVIPIVGMGGLGKTALATLVYKDPRVNAHFDSKVWIFVSDNANITRVLRDIISSLNENTNVDDGLETLQLHLRSIVGGKKLLLVLDDVWTASSSWWEEIMVCFASVAKGSSILVTTRIEEAAKMICTTEPHHLKNLSDKDCWHIVRELAFRDGIVKDELLAKSLEEVGRQIAAKCDGLPLAAKVVGSLLAFKTSLQEWDEVLQNQTLVAQDSIFPVLQLSYNHVSITLQQCLAYCSLFPKDHSIETDTLIKLWMAQGYLVSTGHDVEMIGRDILQNLHMHSFFQDSDYTIGNKTCKIHGTVHDFLRSLSKMECFTMKFDRVTGSDCRLPDDRQMRHSTLVIAAQSSLPVSVCKLQNLRTLLILSDYALVSTSWLRQMFEHSRHLRALHFSCCSIEKTPTQIGKLHSLRYLNLSYNRNLIELPETVCDLYYLQTLNLDGCDHLEKLPKGIGKLINLRHLQILWTLSLSFLPEGIGKLISLRTLNRFVVSPSSGNKACMLGDLDKLKKLRGYLYIDGLADLASADEARKASLHSKGSLFGLDLWFSGAGTDKNKMDQVLEALKPHSDLPYLGIHYFGGTMLPTWMTLLTNLKELILFNCTNCENFLCVATLPSLESLEIRDMENVKELSFDLGVHSNSAFPALNRLCIYNMKRLNDWKVIVGGATASPCPLLQLSIGNCPELEALPHHLQATTLKELSISECPKLNAWLQTTENWDKVSHIDNIKIDGRDVQRHGRRSSDQASSSGGPSRTFTRIRSGFVQ